MPLIYRKTAKGAAEVGNRANRLPPRVRSLLILVDGKRDASMLAAFATQADDVLATLLSDGYIEVVRDAPAASRAAAPASPSSSAPPRAAAPANAGAGAGNFAERRRAAVRALTDAIGPGAETMAMKIERTRSDDELRPLLMQAANVIATMRNRSVANDFANRFLPSDLPSEAAG